MAQPVQTGTEAHGGNHGGGVFPPFDNATFANQLVWLALVFGALYLLMSRIALPRVEGILSKRNKVLQDDLDAAHAFKLETDTSISDYAKALDDAKKNAQQIAAKTSDELKIQSDAKRREVDAALTTRLAKAEARVDRNAVARDPRSGTGLDPAGEEVVNVARGPPVNRVGLHRAWLSLHVHQKNACLGAGHRSLHSILADVRKHGAHAFVDQGLRNGSTYAVASTCDQGSIMFC